jgi:hypothetical protein
MEQSEMKNLTLWAICHSQLGILPFDKLRAGSLRMTSGEDLSASRGLREPQPPSQLDISLH